LAQIGLLAGTFDPIHLGHIELAKAAITRRGLNEVLVVLNANPVHKVGVSAFRHRMAMAELAVGDESNIRVYGGECEQSKHVPATFVDILRELGGDRAEFVMGIDIFLTMDRWPEVESVVKNATYTVARRRGLGEREVAALRQRLGALGPELEVYLLDLGAHQPASSSRVRVQVRAGERPVALNERVYQYILDNSLYI
jgi:nicotinate-nucleotide adenylyltransferase